MNWDLNTGKQKSWKTKGDGNITGRKNLRLTLSSYVPPAEKGPAQLGHDGSAHGENNTNGVNTGSQGP